MTEYSPTPWTVEDVGHELKVLDAKGYRVATVYRLRSNADLLATSPQLLEACKEAYEYLDRFDTTNLELKNIVKDTIRKAIAAAEGAP